MHFWDKVNLLLKTPAGQKPTQQHIDDLYRQLDQFVEQCQREAFAQNKPLLIVIGEQHTFAHNSVLIESMLLDIGKRRGIKNLFYENTADYLESRLDFPPSQDLSTINDIDNSSGSISFETIEHAHKNSFRIIPTEVTIRGHEFNALREKEMVQTLAWDSSGSGLGIFGADHLKAICEDSMLNSKFLVRPINTVPFEFYGLDGSDSDIDEFTFHPDKVTQFRLAGDIFHTKPTELLWMANKADASFVVAEAQKKHVPDSLLQVSSAIHKSSSWISFFRKPMDEALRHLTQLGQMALDAGLDYINSREFTNALLAFTAAQAVKYITYDLEPAAMYQLRGAM